MSFAPRILAFAGSLRSRSYNKKLVKVAAEGARAAGACVSYVDLRDLDLPLYDGDLEAEQGLPPGALKLKALMGHSHGFLIASPEYNSTVSAALKNAIDWASRRAPGEGRGASFAGKVAALMSTAPGGWGGVRGLPRLREILTDLNVIVLPQQVAIPRSDQAFNPDDTLKDEKQRASIAQLGADVAAMAAKLFREP